MTSEIKYRLGEYIIIEHGGILLTWESHIAVGAQLNGRCFIIGDVLVIGPWEHEEAGYLMLEFHEQLMKLPAWMKTTYYCFASSIRKVSTGQSLWGDLVEHTFIPISDMGTKGPGTFRLGQYKITVDGNTNVSWQTCNELNRIIGGKCITESGIIFIGPKEYESDDGENRRIFIADQNLLPQWDKAVAWGDYGSLLICKKPEPRESYTDIWKPENIKAYITNNMPFYQRKQFLRERTTEYTSSGFDWIKLTWHRIVEWKIWSRITPLVIACILVGFRIILFLVGKFVYICLRIIERFRAHNKE